MNNDYLTEPGSRPLSDGLRRAGIEVIAADELAGLRADRERLEAMVVGGYSVKWNVFAQCYYVLPFRAQTHIGEGKTWREAIDAARGAK